MKSVLQHVYFGNTLQDWLFAAGILLGAIVLIAIAGNSVIGWLKKFANNTKNKYDNILLLAIEKFIFPLLYVGSFYLALSYLSLTPKTDKIVHWLLLLLYTFFILRIITAIIQQLIYSFLLRQEGGETKQKQARGFIIIAKFIVWVVGFVFVLDNLGFNVSAIIAGLGVGGIAIALAAQAVLGDLFSYFIIFFDRPFEIGDYIVFDTEMGVVEYIGVKSTRIRTLNGQVLVCSNKDLTNARVNNYKNITRRRALLKIGVVYQTSPEKLQLIPGLVKGIIVADQGVEFERGHFIGFGDSSLDFEFVYFVPDPDYKNFLDKQQAINFALFSAFQKEGIDLAYPSQTLYLVNDKKDEAQIKVSQPPTQRLELA
jgi:small-conductance mechanosensitive channel